jgi:photosystem II stability/assembly factor-like uncharacterized protein
MIPRVIFRGAGLAVLWGGIAALSATVTGTAAAAAAPPAEVWEPVGLTGGGAMYSLALSPQDARLVMLSCDMSGAYLSRDAGRTWQMIHHRSLQGCTTCAAAFHPSERGRIVAPGGWGGRPLRLSTDGGATWGPYIDRRTPWPGRPTVLYFDPGGATTLFIGTDSGAWVTHDDAKTIQECKGLSGKVLGFAADRSSPAPRRVFFAGTSGGVFRSDDAGATFRPAGDGLPAGKPILAFAGGSSRAGTRLYVTVPCEVVGGKLAGGVYVSRDGARSWQRAMNPEINVQTRRSSPWANGDVPQYPFVVTTDLRPERAYVYGAGTSYFPPNHSTVYRTDDGGQSWRAVLFSDPRFKEYNADDDWLTKGIGQRWQDVPETMAGCQADPDVVMTASGMFVFRTEDGGRRWRVCHTIAAPGAAAAPRGESAWLNNGLVVTSTWNYYADPHDPRRHYICYTDIGLARSLDAGRSWLWQGPALPWKNTVYELAFDPAAPGRLWGAFSNTHDIPNGNIIEGRHRVRMDGGVAASDDFGKTWTKVALPEAPAVSVVLDPSSPRDRRTLWASLFEKGVYRSDDGGRTWREKNRGLGHAANMRCCRLIRHADGTLFVVVTAKRLADGSYTLDGVGLYRSADRGETWTKINASLPLHWPKDFAVHPADSRTVLLAAADVRGRREGGLYRTADGGKTWALLARKGPEHFGAAYHPARKGWIYMTLTEGAPECGLYLSRDDGRTWEPFAGLPFANIQRVHFVPGDVGRIHVTTFGGSVFRGPAQPGGGGKNVRPSPGANVPSSARR